MSEGLRARWKEKETRGGRLGEKRVKVVKRGGISSKSTRNELAWLTSTTRK